MDKFQMLPALEVGDVQVLQAFKEWKQDGSLFRRTNGAIFIKEDCIGTFFKEFQADAGQAPVLRTGIDLPDEYLVKESLNASDYQIGAILISDVVKRNIGRLLSVRVADSLTA